MHIEYFIFLPVKVIYKSKNSKRNSQYRGYTNQTTKIGSPFDRSVS